MSVIFHLNNGGAEVVPFELLTSSKVLGAVLSDLHLKDDIELDVKPEFTKAFHFYIDFLLSRKSIVTSAEELLQCLAIEDYYEDKDFLIYLVSQAYKFWSTIFPYLPDDDEVWLRSPYEFVPVNLRTQQAFFDDWLAINANKQVVLDDDKIYHTDLTYYDEGGKQKREVDIYHTVNEERVGYSFKVGWYESGQREYRTNYKDGKLDSPREAWYANPSIQGGQVKYQRNYKDGKLDGLWEAWYADGQREYRWNYRDGKQDGLQERWYADGQPEYRHNYKDGKQDGLQKAWYAGGQPEYRHNYKDGKQDGLQEGWYENGQPKYRDNYKDGKRDGLQEDWYANGQAQYQINYKDGKLDGLRKGWYENGQPMYIKEYRMGKLISEQQF